MQPAAGGYTSRISSMSAPECSTAGRRTYSASQLDHEERDAVERSRVDSCNISPRHDGGEGVGGRRGGTDAGVAPTMAAFAARTKTRPDGMTEALPQRLSCVDLVVTITNGTGRG